MQQVRSVSQGFPGAESGKNRKALRLQNSLLRNLLLSGLTEQNCKVEENRFFPLEP